jgi:molybdate transport repressor ModE-like protein
MVVVMDSETALEPLLDAHTLRLMKAIADAGSLTGAAAALGYSQPAVSQHVRRVEQRLGVPVVERAGRRVRLTEAGRILARHAPAVTTALEAAVGELSELRGLRAGRVRLAAFPSASSAVVPSLLRFLRTHHPGMTVTFVEAEPPEAIAAVRADRADVAVTFSYPGDRRDPHRLSAAGLHVTTIGEDDLLLVLPRDHPAAVSSEVDLPALRDEEWIAGCPDCRGHLLELCERAGFTPRIAFETDNYLAVEALVAQGLGVATLPRWAVESFSALPGIVVRPLPREEPRSIHVVTARDAERVPAVRATVAALRSLIRTPEDRDPPA